MAFKFSFTSCSNRFFGVKYAPLFNPQHSRHYRRIRHQFFSRIEAEFSISVSRKVTISVNGFATGSSPPFLVHTITPTCCRKTLSSRALERPTQLRSAISVPNLFNIGPHLIRLQEKY